MGTSVYSQGNKGVLGDKKCYKGVQKGSMEHKYREGVTRVGACEVGRQTETHRGSDREGAKGNTGSA